MGWLEKYKEGGEKTINLPEVDINTIGNSGYMQPIMINQIPIQLDTLPNRLSRLSQDAYAIQAYRDSLNANMKRIAPTQRKGNKSTGGGYTFNGANFGGNAFNSGKLKCQDGDANCAKLKYKEGGTFLGTTNKGNSYNSSWGGAFQNGGEMSYYQQGQDWKPKGMGKKGTKIKQDNLGYYNEENLGKPVQINSNNITMQGIDFPILAKSNKGEEKLLMPNSGNHFFKGNKVTEYPIAKYGINELEQLTDFSNKPSKKWLEKWT